MLWSDDCPTMSVSMQLTDLPVPPLLLQCPVPWSQKNADWYKSFTAEGTILPIPIFSGQFTAHIM